MKRKLLFMIVILEITMISLASTAFAYSGSDYTSNSSLAQKIDNLIQGNATIFSNTSATFKVGSSLNNSTEYKWKYNSYSGYQCYAYGQAAYYYLFGDVPYHGGGAYSNSSVVSGVKGLNVLSYDVLASLGIGCGAYIRTTPNSSGEYNGDDGHSMIILTYDSSSITVLHGNANGNGLVAINSYSWSDFNSRQLSGRGRYVSHIVQPNLTAGNGTKLGDDFYGVIFNKACWKPISQVEGSTKIFLETENGSARQVWRFQRQSNGAYVISSCYDGMILEMTDGITEECTQISAPNDSYWGGSYQRWYLIPYGDGYIFKSDHFTSDNWVLDLYEGQSNDGNIIEIYHRNNSPAQIWSIYTGDEVQIKGTELTVTPGTSVTPTKFEWASVYGASIYNLRIRNVETNEDFSQWKVSSGFEMILPEGNYAAYVDVCNHFIYRRNDTDATFTVNNAYCVTYNAPGVLEEPIKQAKEKGVELTLYKSFPTYFGHTFLGWATSPGGVAVYQPGDRYNQDQNLSLYAVWRQLTAFCLPAQLTTIEENAFANSAVEFVVCPEGLRSIGDGAFANCRNLKQIYIPESVTIISDTAFDNCQEGIIIWGVMDSNATRFVDAHSGFLFRER